MSGVGSPSGQLNLPRDEHGLATSRAAVRRLREVLPAFLEDVVAEAGVDGVVVRLDSSVESVVAATLAVGALGPDRVRTLGMPAQLMDEAIAQETEAIADVLGVDHHRFQLHPVLVAFQDAVGSAGGQADDLMATQNALERFRMACAYYVANATNRLVVGSVPRTTYLLGTLTKYGHTGVDVALFGDLYRTELRELASALDVPVTDGHPRSAPGDVAPPDAERLGVEQATLDSLLRLRLDEGHSVSTVAQRTGVDAAVVERVEAWCRDARHKRRPPVTPFTAN